MKGSLFGAALAAAAVALACEDHVAPAARPTPASMVAVTSPAALVTVGQIAGAAVVRVTDANGAPITGVPVLFVVSLGSGSLSRAGDTTTASGMASTVFTAGTQRAVNEVSALVKGLPPVKFSVAGVEGPSRFITLGTRDLRIAPGLSSAAVTATARDTFFNATNAPINWVARDTSVLDVTTGGVNQVRVSPKRRPAQTWIVGSVDKAADSILVTVQDASAPCAFLATPASLPIGGIMEIPSGTACLHADTAGAEFTFVGHYNTAVTNVFAIVTATANGIVTTDTSFPPAATAAVQTSQDAAFERSLRARESRAIAPYVDGARAWYAARPSAIRAQAKEGDVVSVNVNAFDFCAAPRLHSARVAAITRSAVILADAENPAGGFTDAEYRAFGELMDTLVNPVDTTAFGKPTDIDGNGRTVILFTKAVNALTAQGSPSGIVLGFYYLRDLLPLRSPFGDCPGSNVAEMFYMLVPDPAGTINGNVRDKAFVQNVTASTIAHEYQHLINASRRMYVINAPRVDEESWLNEGLSHIAEELLFYRVSGLRPRSDLGGAAIAGAPVRAALDATQLNNLKRYREYLRNPEDESPVAGDDELATRGASWSFLRYAADRTRPADGDFWRKLVNSQLTGALNLDAALAPSGVNTLQLLADWSLSVLTDNVVPEPVALQQPSWNFPSAMPAVNVAYPLSPRVLQDGRALSVQMIGGGTTYMRFGVAPGRDALFQVTGFNGRPLPAGMRLSVVRIK